MGRFIATASLFITLLVAAADVESTEAMPTRWRDMESLEECDPDTHGCQCPPQGGGGGGGRSIRVATFVNHCLRLRRNAEAFEAVSGVSVRVECLGYDELHEEILSDVRTQTGYYDGFMFGPSFTGEMAKVAGLHDLTPYVQGEDRGYDLRWNDIFRFNRENAAVYDNKVRFEWRLELSLLADHIETKRSMAYVNSHFPWPQVLLIPLDGDVLSLYYRKDLFEKYTKVPPTTWDEYTDLAKFFHGKVEPLPGSNDTVTLSGSCVGRKFSSQEEHWVILILSSMTQYGGTKTGFLFDTTTMDPLLGEAFVKTLQYTEEQFAYGADNEMDGGTFQSTNIAKMNAGTCAMTYNWGDSFTEGAKGPPTSLVSGLIGTSHTPGSKSYFDRSSQRLMECTENICSCSDAGESSSPCTNMAPYAAFTGWSGGVNSFTSPRGKADATDFFAYASSPAVSLADTIPNITAGAPYIGVDPFRTSHTKAEDWIEKGLPEAMVVSYLDTIREQQSHENAVLDNRIPLVPSLVDELRKIMNEHMSAISDKKARGITGDALMSSDEERWMMERKLREKWTALIDTYNAENNVKLVELYQRSLGIYTPEFNIQDLSKIRPIGLTLSCILMLTAFGFACWTYALRWNNIVKVSQPRFLYTFCFGCFVLGSSIIPLSIDDSIASEEGASVACMAFPWLVCLGFSLIFSALSSKLLRAKKILKSSLLMRQVKVRHRDVLEPFAVLLVVNVTILSVWTALDPLRWVRTYSIKTLESVGHCRSSGDAWVYCVSFLLVADFSAIVAANVLAYQSKDMGADFVESKWIILSTGSIMQSFILGVPLVALGSQNGVAHYFVLSVLTFIVGETCALLVFLPKVYEIHTRRDSIDGQVSVIVPSRQTRLSDTGTAGFRHGARLSDTSTAGYRHGRRLSH
ncbi:hypothetical protein ACHAWF_015242, partial [Thalassiosira exigua]